MLVVIPTYRRNECLQWVLQSLVQCDVTGISEQIRVLVVNNYPPAADEISAIVALFRAYKRYDWHILYRERTLDPVDNWYSAIAEYAQADEVVFINSDDDLFLPWSLYVRYSAISAENGDVLLAQLGPTAFFLDDASRIACTGLVPQPIATEPVFLNCSEITRFSPQHISNHCYRNTKCFRRALARGTAWCDVMDWLDSNSRRLYLPLYLPLAVIFEEGHVLGLSVPCILRGQDLDEVARVPFGVANWNTGFIHLPAWHVLRNTDLAAIPSLEKLRDEYATTFIKWFLTYFVDRRVGWRKLMLSMRHTGFPWGRLFSPKTAYGLRLLVGEWLGLRGVRFRRATANAQPSNIFVANLLQLTTPVNATPSSGK